MNFKIKSFASTSVAISVAILVTLTGCSSFEAERVDEAKADEKAMEITDNWVDGDTIRVIDGSMKQVYAHKRFAEYQSKFQGKRIKLFVGEIRNNTSESYFPVKDLEDALLEKCVYASSRNFLDDDPEQQKDRAQKLPGFRLPPTPPQS